jgi:hypothetical protein
MKLKIKSIDERGNLLCIKSHGFPCEVDLFAGEAAKGVQREDISKILKVGDVIEISDDTHMYKPLYLPSEYKLVEEQEEPECCPRGRIDEEGFCTCCKERF